MSILVCLGVVVFVLVVVVRLCVCVCVLDGWMAHARVCDHRRCRCNMPLWSMLDYCLYSHTLTHVSRSLAGSFFLQYHSTNYDNTSFHVVITSHLDHVVANHTILAHPLYDTGYFEGPFQGIAFEHANHAETFRARTADYYNLTRGGGCPSNTNNKTQPVIRILNRAPQSNRTLLNVDALQTALAEMTQSTVDVVYFENKTFLEQVAFMMDTDILISPHGAQLTSINFM